MFQFKTSGLGVKEPDGSNAMPNSFGKVRTFKEDLENFGKAKVPADNPEEIELPSAASQNPPVESPSPKQEFPQAAPVDSNTARTPENPFQSIPTPPPLSSANEGLPDFKSLPSQSFFAENPPKKEIIPSGMEENRPAPPKSKSKMILPLVVVFVVATFGAVFYYYWFYLKTPATSSIPTEQPVPNPSPAVPPVSSDAQNKNLRQLVVDTSQGPTEIKSAVGKFAAEFAASASEDGLIETKIIGKDNSPIGKKDFFAGFGAAVPEAVLMKLSEDYSLFVKKEGGAARLGLVFKTVTASGLADEMKNWESTIAKDILPLYAGQTPTGTGTFNSNRYKNADIRYSNFSSPEGASLDYSVISNFLVIGTSKDSTRTILDYMSEK